MMHTGLNDASANSKFPTPMSIPPMSFSSIPVSIPTSASPRGIILQLPWDLDPDTEKFLDLVFTRANRYLNGVAFDRLLLRSLLRISQN